MSDKLQKTDREIVPASNIKDKLESAFKDDKPASTGMCRPNADDVCKCGHTYSEHNYSDSLGSRKDPLGFMYECRGGGFDTPPANLRGMKARCACEQFEFVDVPIRIITDETTCVDGLNLLVHNCPGSVENAAGGRTKCKCSCMSCLTKQRESVGLIPRVSFFDPTRRVACLLDSDDHSDCPVVLVPLYSISGRIPRVCPCDCRDCKRRWFADGRPVVRNGQIVRDTDWVNIRGEKVAKPGGSIALTPTVENINKAMREWTRQQAKVANFGEQTERAGMSPKTLINTDFEALELRAIAEAIEDPDLRIGCGAEFPTIVNGKTLRCKKWKGHEGQHSDKLDGIPINWANNE